MRSFFAATAPYTSPRGSFAIQPSDTIDARALSANTAELVTIPADAKFVVFSANADFFAKFGANDGAAAATVPGDVTNGGASELNPAVRQIPEGMTRIGVISAATCIITLAWYA